MPILNAPHRHHDPYFAVIIGGLVLGLLFPRYVSPLAPYAAWLLSGIFFLSALKINLRDVQKYITDGPLLAATTAAMLIIFPLGTYVILRWVQPEFAVAGLLLAAMPAGMATPLLAELSGGRPGLALVLAVVTSLLAPFTVPVIVNVTLGAELDLNLVAMFVNLSSVIFVPFALALIVRRYAPSATRFLSLVGRPTSIILLGLLQMAIVGANAQALWGSLVTGKLFPYLVWVVGLFAFFHLLGYFVVFWHNQQDRLTISICLTYMNIVLAIYLANKFMPEPQIVVPLIVGLLPWSFMLAPFRFVTRRLGLA